MAERRMFAKTIIDSDAFLDMPLSTQALYFHLSMRADDDGFLNNAKKIMRTIGANQNDYDLLIAKSFIIQFDDGICVIKHWRINNYLRSDRYKPTVYADQMKMLEVKENGRYSVKNGVGIPLGIPDGNPGKDSIGKDSIGNNILSGKQIEQLADNHPYVSIIQEVVNYLNLKAGTNFKSGTNKTQSCIKARIKEGFSLDDFKLVIDKKCKSWKGTEWEKYLRPETLFGTKFEGYLNEKDNKPQPKQQFLQHIRSNYDFDEIERMVLK